MKLLIDIGNSAVKWVLKEGSQLSRFSRELYRNNLQANLFKNFPAARLTLESIYIASVASHETEAFFSDHLVQRYGLKPVFLTTQARFHGVINAYTHPDQLGIDRWLAIIAAYQQVRGAVLVVNCGTAVTIDAVNGTGKHLGGLILPGVFTMWEGLNANARITTKVERGDLDQLNIFATDTDTAVTQGPLIAIVATIEKVLSKLRADEQQITCILTGGDASKLQALLNEKTVLSPHLVLEGLSLRIDDDRMD